MNERMKLGRWVTLAIFSLLAIGLVPFLPASAKTFDMTFLDRAVVLQLPERPPWNTLLPYLLLAKTILSSVNSVLLTILLLIYIGVYRKTGAEFSLGLVIFSTALLLYSLTANPLIHLLAGFRLSGLGPFTMLPDLFTCIASAVLLYLSQQ